MNKSRSVRPSNRWIEEAMTKPPANVLELPLELHAEMALKAAVEKLIVDHARKGLPLYIWRDGRVVEVRPMNCERNLSACRGNRYKNPPLALSGCLSLAFTSQISPVTKLPSHAALAITSGPSFLWLSCSGRCGFLKL